MTLLKIIAAMAMGKLFIFQFGGGGGYSPPPPPPPAPPPKPQKTEAQIREEVIAELEAEKKETEVKDQQGVAKKAKKGRKSTFATAGGAKGLAPIDPAKLARKQLLGRS